MSRISYNSLKFRFKELNGVYARDSDTLTVGNGKVAASSGAMAKGLTAHYDEAGKVAGFTLERAQEELLPHLQMRPTPTAER